MEKKIHYKLHKVKKQWVTIAVTTLALVVGLGAATSTQVVTADETSAVTVTRGSDSSGAGVDSSKTQATDTTTSNSDTVTEASTSTTDEDTTIASDDSQKVTVTTTAQGEQKTTKNTAEEASQTSSTSADETTTVLAEDEKTTKDPDTTTTTDASSDKVSDKAEETADADADKENKSETETSDDKTKDALAEEVSHSAVSETGESTDQLSLDNIKKIDGKYYYVQADGSVKKNFAITVNGQLLYFDAETGALTSTSTYSFTEGLTNLVDNFSKNNQAYDSTEKSFELVDGYLTANSWYRPTKVLENGETWVDSTEESFRPLVMAWWPDVDTQINYLNSMS